MKVTAFYLGGSYPLSPIAASKPSLCLILGSEFPGYAELSYHKGTSTPVSLTTAGL